MNQITLSEQRELNQELIKNTYRLEALTIEMKEAHDQGDLSENEEYHLAKKERLRVVAKIDSIKEKLSYDVIESMSEGIDVGKKIELTIKDATTGETKFNKILTIVSLEDKTPLDGYLSILSPIYQKLKSTKSTKVRSFGKNKVEYEYSYKILES